MDKDKIVFYEKESMVFKEIYGVDKTKGLIIGLARYKNMEEKRYLDWVWVAKEYREEGIGTELVELVLGKKFYTDLIWNNRISENGKKLKKKMDKCLSEEKKKLSSGRLLPKSFILEED
jgi:GNAT superfamily N-acetyltransferase